MLNCKEISQNSLPIHPLSESKTLMSILQVYSVAAKRNVPTEGKQTHFNALIKEIAHDSKILVPQTRSLEDNTGVGAITDI